MKKKINNFLNPKQGRKKISPKVKKISSYLLTILLAILVAAGILFGIYKKPGEKIYYSSIDGKNEFINLQKQLANQDFEMAKESLNKALDDFQTAHNEFQKFSWLKPVPWLGTQISAVDNLLMAGISAGQSIDVILGRAIAIITPLQKDDEISLSSLSEKQTEQLLKDIYESKPYLEEAKKSIDDAVAYTNNIPNKGLLNKLKKVIEPIKEQIPSMQEAIDKSISASQIIPYVAGYPEKRTYLFLLQNNTELRPTGGFIGTYGILKLKNGDIDQFKTDNSYNLDKPAEQWLSEEPPWPLTRYNKVFKWFFRDSNWSPDFPTSAKKAEWFYHQEKGSEKNIDGIIAVTPTFIQSLLTLTGDIKVNGFTFTQENFVDKLQYLVTQGFLKQGIEEKNRKEIIGVLSKKILDKVMELPKNKWLDLWQIIDNNISEKQVLIYLKNNKIQDYISKENWSGEINQTKGDYFTVIDANLASLKSDPYVERTIVYKVSSDPESGNLIADLKITYHNKGEITWKTTRYRTYTRVYVPLGSKLLKNYGSMVDCKIDKEGSVEVSEELNKTVFGTFICIEPGEEKQLLFKYKLPDEISKMLQENIYHVLVQKQAGTSNYPLQLDFDFEKRLANPKKIKGLEKNSKNAIIINSVLSSDKNYYLELK